MSSRISKNDLVEGITTYTYDDNDRLKTEELKKNNVVVQTIEYRYDDNGNLKSRIKNGVEEVSYTWDKENRLIEVRKASGEVISYQYDSDGIRVSSTVNGVKTEFLVDKNLPYAQVLEEMVNNGLTAGYVYGNDLISQQRGSEKSFYLVDGLGSTRGLTNSSGVVTDRYSYDAFGNLIGSTNNVQNNYLFAGEQFDRNLGDYYLRARYYDSDTGRFTRRDTYEGRISKPITLHKYLYGNANPLMYTDPTGLYSVAEANAAISISNVLDSIHLDSGQRFVAAALGDRDPSPASMAWDTLFALGLAASVPLYSAAVALGPRQAKAITFAVSNVTKGFDIGACDVCATAIKKKLKSIGVNGTHIRIETVSRSGFDGNIYSKTANDLISHNGYHEGIVVKMNGLDVVFDNVHKNGIPKQQWLDDFEVMVPLKPEIVLETF